MSALVVAMFRDEAAIMPEWFHHYTSRGITDFLLLNDRSKDAWENTIPAAANVRVENVGRYPLTANRQGALYNLYIPTSAKNFKRVLVVDMDEFLYDATTLDLGASLLRAEWFSIPVLDFGCGGFYQQPSSVVNSFIKRERDLNHYGPVRTKWCGDPRLVRRYDLHRPYPNAGVAAIPKLNNLTTTRLRINHYKLQSEDYWKHKVIPNGSANCTESGRSRHTQQYRELRKAALGAVEDTGLIEQNIKYGCTWKPQHCY